MALVHVVLPEPFGRAATEVLERAGVPFAAHGDGDPVGAAERAAADAGALALIGPFRSHHVAEAVEVTAPAGLALVAPVATWAGVTRDDEPGCDDAARHRGTVLRIVARDTVVAGRIAREVERRGERALVVAGGHEYGVQLDGQLRLAGLPRANDPADAGVIVLAGLADGEELARLRELPDRPVIAFDGVQGGDLGGRGDVRIALPFAPEDGAPAVAGACRRAAELVAAARHRGAADRAGTLAALRELGPFDAHGDPVDPPVWLWRADADWALTPDRALAAS